MTDQPSQGPDRAVLRSYLLDKATQEEMEQVERFLFEDASGLQQVQATEADLLADSALGELPLAERQRVLAHAARHVVSTKLANQLAKRFYSRVVEDGALYQRLAEELQAKPLWEIRAERREALLALLAPDREQAGARYEDLRGKLHRFFMLHGGLPSRADEAIYRITHKLVQEESSHAERPFAHVLGVARQVVQEMLRQDRKFPGFLVGAGELPPSSGAALPDLEALLASFAPDREQAGAIYEDIRRRLVWLFEWQLGWVSERMADEALDRVAGRLARGTLSHIEKPFAYVRGVARNVAQEMLRERAREALTAAVVFDDREPEQEVDPRLACMEDCLGQLPADQRRLILLYYERSSAEDRRRLADELGIGSNALRIRAHRIRRQLEGCCSRCLEAMDEKRARPTSSSPPSSGTPPGRASRRPSVRRAAAWG